MYKTINDDDDEYLIKIATEIINRVLREFSESNQEKILRQIIEERHRKYAATNEEEKNNFILAKNNESDRNEEERGSMTSNEKSATTTTNTTTTGDGDSRLNKVGSESLRRDCSNNFGLIYQMDCTGNQINCYQSMLAGQQIIKIQSKSHNTNDTHKRTSLLQIANSTLIANANRSYITDTGSISILDTTKKDDDNFNVVSCEDLMLTSLRMSYNQRRSVLAGLPRKGHENYRIWNLCHIKGCQLLRKSKCNKEDLSRNETGATTSSSPLKLLDAVIFDVDINISGNQIVTFNECSVITIFDVDTNTINYRSNRGLTELNPIASCKWFRDASNRLVVFEGMSHDLKILDLDKQKYQNVYKNSINFEEKIVLVDVAEDGKIAFGMSDRSLRLYDPVSNQTTLISNSSDVIFRKKQQQNLWNSWGLDGMVWNVNDCNQIMRYAGNEITIFDIRAVNACYMLKTEAHIRAACFL